MHRFMSRSYTYNIYKVRQKLLLKNADCADSAQINAENMDYKKSAFIRVF